jgi:micrococcal nuclease
MTVRWRAPLGALFLLVPPSAALAADIYRWTDDTGQTHFGDRPPPQAERIGRTGGQGSSLERVAEVIDGDTLALGNGKKVRLIGINAPEVAYRDEPAEPGGPEARRFLVDLLAGGKVRLGPGEQSRDQYGRLLAYVATPAGTDIGAELLRRGHAHVAIRPPNTARLQRYLALEASARSRERGIWSRPRYRLRSASEAGDFRNTFRRLRGRVVEVDSARKYSYVHFAGGLVARLKNANREAFARRSRSPQSLVGREVIVRGWVRQEDGDPLLILRHPEQIEAVQ